MKRYKDGGTPKKARLESRAAKKMGKAQRTYKEAEATLSDAKSSGMKMDYADAEQLFNRSARQGERAKKLKAKASMMQVGGSTSMSGRSISEKAAARKVAKGKGTISKPYPSGPEEKGSYVGYSKEARKSDSPWKSMKDSKPARKIMKTGGMVNANSKVSKQTVPGSKGVKSGVNPKAAASKRATGRSGGTSTAPKTALPKAQLGKIVKMMSSAGKASGKAANKAMDFRSPATKKDMATAIGRVETKAERARLKKILQDVEKKFKP